MDQHFFPAVLALRHAGVQFSWPERGELGCKQMLHECYIAFMLQPMSRPKEDPVYNRVEALRSHRGLSRQQLADLVGVHYQTIGYIERGEYSPSLLLALKIAHALDCELTDIFSITPFEGEAGRA